MRLRLLFSLPKLHRSDAPTAVSHFDPQCHAITEERAFPTDTHRPADLPLLRLRRRCGAGLPLRIAQEMACVACDLLLQEAAIGNADYGQVFASM
jgi:hypothetical protein